MQIYYWVECGFKPQPLSSCYVMLVSIYINAFFTVQHFKKHKQSFGIGIEMPFPTDISM